MQMKKDIEEINTDRVTIHQMKVVTGSKPGLNSVEDDPSCNEHKASTEKRSLGIVFAVVLSINYIVFHI